MDKVRHLPIEEPNMPSMISNLCLFYLYRQEKQGQY